MLVEETSNELSTAVTTAGYNLDSTNELSNSRSSSSRSTPMLSNNSKQPALVSTLKSFKQTHTIHPKPDLNDDDESNDLVDDVNPEVDDDNDEEDDDNDYQDLHDNSPNAKVNKRVPIHQEHKSSTTATVTSNSNNTSSSAADSSLLLSSSSASMSPSSTSKSSLASLPRSFQTATIGSGNSNGSTTGSQQPNADWYKQFEAVTKSTNSTAPESFFERFYSNMPAAALLKQQQQQQQHQQLGEHEKHLQTLFAQYAAAQQMWVGGVGPAAPPFLPPAGTSPYGPHMAAAAALSGLYGAGSHPHNGSANELLEKEQRYMNFYQQHQLAILAQQQQSLRAAGATQASVEMHRHVAAVGTNSQSAQRKNRVNSNAEESRSPSPTSSQLSGIRGGGGVDDEDDGMEGEDCCDDSQSINAANGEWTYEEQF